MLHKPRPCIGSTRRIRILLTALLLTLTASITAAQHIPPAEMTIKAAYIYNFTKFVTWPPQALPKPAAPIRICVSDDRQMTDTLIATVKGKNVEGRPLEVLALRDVKDPVSCHILFLTHLETDQRSQLLGKVRGKPVLTVGDEKGFAARGGIINFFVADDRVRFEINIDTARKSGLEISSRLLNLAYLLREKQP